jgi:malate dehydrogenase (oxaloacetate-decarboxylating)(NADP+)
LKKDYRKEEAIKRLWYVDAKWIGSEKQERISHNISFAIAHDFQHLPFREALDAIKPNVFDWCNGCRKFFYTRTFIERMASYHERPIIFALSNPTDRAECTPEQAYTWSKGKAVYASGSPFPPFEYQGKIFKPGQGNNVYIFPGVGLGAVLTKASRLNDDIFLTAAKALAACVNEEDLAQGSVYPPFKNIRKISLEIATAVAEKIFEDGLAGIEKPKNLRGFISAQMYDPRY